MSQDNVTLIRSLYEDFAKGDVPAVLGRFDPQIEWTVAENSPYAAGNPYIGPTAVLEGVFMRLGAEWKNFSVQPQELLDAGATVVALGLYTSVNCATGKPLRAQFAHIWTIQEGKIVKFRHYTDTKQFADVATG